MLHTDALVPSSGRAEGAEQVEPGRRPRNRRPRSRTEGRQQRQEQPTQPTQQLNLPPPSLTGLTWQQEQFLNPTAPPFTPSLPYEREQQPGAGALAQEHRPRGNRSRGRGRGPAGPPPGTLQPFEQAGDGRHVEAAAPAGSHGNAAMLQQDEQGLERPNPRRRRHERPPRAKQQQQRSDDPQLPPQQQQQQGRGVDGGLRALEMAASAAANQRQWRRHDAEALAAGESSASDADGDGGQAAAAAHASPQPLLGAPQQHQQPGRQQKLSGRQRGGGQNGARAGPGGDDGGEAALGDPAAAHPEAPQCLVCCSEMAEVGLGACNHKAVCGVCTLRLRLCYGRRDCPLCKTELKEVRPCRHG